MAEIRPAKKISCDPAGEAGTTMNKTKKTNAQHSPLEECNKTNRRGMYLRSSHSSHGLGLDPDFLLAGRISDRKLVQTIGKIGGLNFDRVQNPLTLTKFASPDSGLANFIKVNEF